MITTHLSALVAFYDQLDTFRGENMGVPQAGILDVFGRRLGFHPSTVQFAKALIFVSQFCTDAKDALGRTSIKENNRDVLTGIIGQLAEPFSYPFNNPDLLATRNSVLPQMVRAHIDLVGDIMAHEIGFSVPEQNDVDVALLEMDKIRTSFAKLSINEWMKADFDQTMGLYVAFLAAYPEMSYRILFETQKNISSYLVMDISPVAKKALVHGLIVVNALLAAFVLPSEVYEAGENYLRLMSGPSQIPSFEISKASPRQLPGPGKSPQSTSKKKAQPS